ncbi:MAG: MarR family transcriptional regulator [Lactobacillus sp.]|jgi:DNA-binding MarR family transcriptional regulator|nr:MarR family transcriptional regulator [Lactobacillus sp.]
MLTRQEINLIRNFNRQYVIQLGVLSRRTYHTDLTWPQARLLIEIGLHHLQTPMELSRQLNLDKSYTSRLINQLVKQGILRKEKSHRDGRSVVVTLTNAGEEVFQTINQRSDEQVRTLIKNLSPEKQAEFLAAVTTIKKLIFLKK